MRAQGERSHHSLGSASVTQGRCAYASSRVARMAASLGWDGIALAQATAHQMDYVWTQA